MSEQRFTIERLDRQPIVSIRSRIPIAEVSSFFDRSYQALYAHVAANGGEVAGPALSCTHAMGEGSFDIEVAVPLREPIPGSDAISAGEVAPFEAAVTFHVGSYTTLGETYAALSEFVRQQGREAIGIGYEFYVDDPSKVPVERRRTRVALPLKE